MDWRLLRVHIISEKARISSTRHTVAILVNRRHTRLVWVVKLEVGFLKITTKVLKTWWVKTIHWSRTRAWSSKPACQWWCSIKLSNLPLLRVQERRASNFRTWEECKVLSQEVSLRLCVLKWAAHWLMASQIKWIKISWGAPSSSNKTQDLFTIQTKQIYWHKTSQVISKLWDRWQRLPWIRWATKI